MNSTTVENGLFYMKSIYVNEKVYVTCCAVHFNGIMLVIE